MTRASTLWLQSSAAGSDPAIWGPYMQSAERHARKIVSPGLSIELHGVSTTYPGIDYLDRAHHLVTREMVRNAITAEQQGYAAYVNITTIDASRAEVREVTDIPAAFIVESAVHLAAQMGDRFAFLTHNPGNLRVMERMTDHYGLAGRLVPGACLAMGYGDFAGMYRDPGPAVAAFREAARQAVARGAKVLIPAGGPVNMFLVDHGLREVDGVPLLDILAVVIKAGEQAIALARAGVPTRGHVGLPPEWKARLRELLLAR